MARRILFSGLCCLMLASCGNWLFSQEGQVPAITQSDSGLSIVSMTVSPQSRVFPGGVLIIRVAVENSSDQAATGYLVGRIDGQLGDEDRRRIELDSGEAKTIDVQLRVAKSLTAPKIEVAMTLNVMQGDREILVQQGDQPVVRTLPMPVLQERNITAVDMDDEPSEQVYWRWPPTKPYGTYELAIATRIDAALSRRCIVLDSEPLPLNLADWKCINTAIIANPLVFNDAANIAVLQQFLQTGGRVWIMLDAIETDAIGDLLAEKQQIETVGTVELNRFEIEVIGHSFSPADRTLDFTDAVQMKRVIQQGGQVTQFVDGWPATIWMPVGRGELLLTTLATTSWLVPRKTQWSIDPVNQSRYTLPMWATAFANQVHSNKGEQPLDMSTATYPLDRIGNPVVSRSYVAAVLGAFCLCLVGFGGWRLPRGELNWLGVVAPTLAVAASLPLFIASMLQRRDIPPMVAALQLVQIDLQTGAFLRESAAVYSSESRAMELIGKGDGLAIPSPNIETGVCSVITDDFQKWRMANDAWPAGTWRYTSELSLPEVSVEAIAHLTEHELSIELPQNLSSPLEDIVVSMVAGAPSLGKLSDDQQRFSVDGRLPAEGERWTTAAIVTDEQRRRAAVYASLFEDSARPAFPLRTLCGWTELWPQAPQWQAELARRGTALVTIPIRLATPDVGSKVRVPYNMIRIEHAGLRNASSIFRQSTGRFIAESTLSTEADLAFILPTEVVPFEATLVTIDWDIRAPKRKARLLGLSGDTPVELATLNEPSIPWTSTITDPRVLQEFRDGRLELRVEVTGDPDLENGESGFVSWQVRHLRLSVEGRTLSRHKLVADLP